MEVASSHTVTGTHRGIIINPKSGKKAFRRQQRYLFRTLKNSGIDFEYHTTKYANHATELARDLVERKVNEILVMGGDGTFSEVVNGILQARNFPEQRITLALFPRGTGNDWGRYWGLKRNFRQAVEVYLKAKKQGIDIGKVEYRRNGELQKHYFVNSAGFGLDHKVVQETHRLKHFVGSHSFLYFIALVKAVFTFRPQALSVSTADMEYSGNVLTMNIGNGCYSGGGIRQNPDADPCDGLLDAMYITRLTFKDICRGVTKLFNGRLNELPFVNTIRCTEMQINGKGYLPFEADGIEVNAAAPYSISLIADAIDMIVP